MARNIIEFLIKTLFDDKGIKQAKEGIGGLEGTTRLAKKALGAFGIALGAKEVLDFNQEARQSAIELESIRAKLIETVGGVEQYNRVIRLGREATMGLASEAEIAQSAFLTMEMGLADSAEEASKLAFAGTVLSDAFKAQGASVELFNRLLASGNQILLDNFGISAEQVNARKAEIEATTQLRDQEARLQAIRDIAIEKAERLAGTMTDTERAAKEATAAYEDMLAKLGEVTLGTQDLAEAQVSLFRFVTEGIEGWQKAAGALDALAAAQASETEIAERAHQLARERGVQVRSLTGLTDEYNALLEEAATQLQNEALAAQVAAATTTQFGAAVQNTLSPLSLEAEAARNVADAYAELNAKRVADAQAIADQYAAGQVYSTGEGSKARHVWGDDAREAESAAERITGAFDDAATDLASTINSVIQPTLSQVWQPEEQEQRVDEWARRLATVATSGLGSEWITQLQGEFAGQEFMQPLFDAVASGDSGAAMEAAKNILTENVTQLYDKELIKQRVREKLQQENLRDELIQEIQNELAAEDITVSTGVIAQAAGDATVAQDEVKTKMGEVETAAVSMGETSKESFDSLKTSTEGVIEATKEWAEILGGIAGKYEEIAKNATDLNPATQGAGGGLEPNPIGGMTP